MPEQQSPALQPVSDAARQAAATIRSNVARIAGQMAVTAANARRNPAITDAEATCLLLIASNLREAASLAAGEG